VLAITVLGSGIAALDATVVNIALPVIGREFHTGVAALQWVMNGYALALAALLLTGGSLGDRLGRRRVYLIGIVWFALASAACRLAPSAVVLIVTRVLQGAGAALLTPEAWRSWKPRSCPPTGAGAIGAWSGLSAIAIAAGPLVGGYLISAASWRWIFSLTSPSRPRRSRWVHGTSPSRVTWASLARSTTRVRWRAWCSSLASHSRSSRHPCSAGRRPPCSR
jgi:MFS family permease